MGIKAWLAKPRLSDENWRNQMAFLGKGIVTVGAAVWALSVGTDFLDKRAMVLGASGMPVADTSWGREVRLSLARPGYCRVAGQYQILNTGDLAFEIEEVLIEVRRVDFEPISAEWEGQKFDATISAMNNSYATSEPLVIAPIKVDEIFSSENRMDTSFVVDFAIPKDLKSSDQFVVFAKGVGGLPETDAGLVSWLKWIGVLGADYVRFGANDLRISSNTFQISSQGCADEFGYTKEGAGDLIVEVIAR